MSSTTDAPRPESQPDAQSDSPAETQGSKSWLRRLWPFAALGAGVVAVGLGTATLVAIQPPAPAVPSPSVVALRSAHDDAAHLAALARGAGQPATAEVLDLQARVVATAPGVEPGAATGSTTASLSPSPSLSPSRSGTESTTAARELVDGLSASVAARLTALGEVDGPTATLIASLAAGQSLQIDDLAAATGVTPSPAPSAGPSGSGPSAGSSPSAGSGPSASPSPSASCATPSASSSGPSSPSPSPLAAALAAVDRTESASIYTLETALARAPRGTAEADARASALDARRRLLAAVAALAAANCTALPPPDPAFAVSAGFAADPSPTIDAESKSAEQAWAQLVGALPAAGRPAAAGSLLAAARLGSAGGSAPEKAFPGVPSAQQPVQQPTRQP